MPTPRGFPRALRVRNPYPDPVEPLEAFDLSDFAGWIPAVIFPSASFLQFMAIVRRKSAAGVSALSWLLFAVANVSLFFYMERHFELQSIIGALGTAIVNLMVVAAIWWYRDGAVTVPAAPSGTGSPPPGPP